MRNTLVAGAFVLVVAQAGGCFLHGGGAGGYYAPVVAQEPAPPPPPDEQQAAPEQTWDQATYDTSQQTGYQEAPAYQEPAPQPTYTMPAVSYTRITPDGVFVGTDGAMQRDSRDTASGQQCDTLDPSVPACPSHYICNGGANIYSHDGHSSQPGACMADGSDSYWR